VSLRQKRLLAAGLALHLFFVITVSLQDFAATLSQGGGRQPRALEGLLHWLGLAADTALARPLPVGNPIRQAVTTYTDWSGIEAGYSYFAPAVPGNCRLVFELHYADGRIDYDIPVVGSGAAGYRLATLLDHLRLVRYLRLREALVRTLVNSIHREHPDAVLIRAIFGVASLTTPAEYRAGRRNSYQALYAYDFRFRSGKKNPPLSRRQ